MFKQIKNFLEEKKLYKALWLSLALIYSLGILLILSNSHFTSSVILLVGIFELIILFFYASPIYKQIEKAWKVFWLRGAITGYGNDTVNSLKPISN